jgi:hypothetical protein
VPAPKFKRYALKNHRPGEAFHLPVGIVQTDPGDGGARLSPEQKKWLEEHGYELVEVAAVAPEPEPPQYDERTAARIAENKAAAASQADEEQRVAKAQLAPGKPENAHEA